MGKFKPTKILTLVTGAIAIGIAYAGYKSKLKGLNSTENNNNNIISLPEPEIIKETDDMPMATIKIKDIGEMQFILYPTIAPNTVNNFIYLANSGSYNNLYFNRVIKDFIVQGGMEKYKNDLNESYTIKDEFSPLKHKPGIISMSRTLEKDSASKEFFIVTGDCTDLDGKYTAFGRLVAGSDILEILNNTANIPDTEIPQRELLIESISVDTKGQNYLEPEKI